MTTLSKSAEFVQRALCEKGLKFEVVELNASTRTANDAAMTIGCQVKQIVKSLLFRTKETHKPVLVLASGKNRVSEKVIQKYVGEKIEKADADFTREITGFAIGGIPPLGHKNPIPFVYIDEDLLQNGQQQVHTFPEGHGFFPGANVTMKIDWLRRNRLMRLHFTCELILVLMNRLFNQTPEGVELKPEEIDTVIKKRGAPDLCHFLDFEKIPKKNH